MLPVNLTIICCCSIYGNLRNFANFLLRKFAHISLDHMLSFLDHIQIIWWCRRCLNKHDWSHSSCIKHLTLIHFYFVAKKSVLLDYNMFIIRTVTKNYYEQKESIYEIALEPRKTGRIDVNDRVVTNGNNKATTFLTRQVDKHFLAYQMVRAKTSFGVT
jgi:hypothetical protein